MISLLICYRLIRIKMDLNKVTKEIISNLNYFYILFYLYF